MNKMNESPAEGAGALVDPEDVDLSFFAQEVEIGKEDDTDLSYPLSDEFLKDTADKLAEDDLDFSFPDLDAPEEKVRKAEEAERKRAKKRREFYDLASVGRWRISEEERLGWAVSPLFPRGMTTLMPGGGGIGKSLLCQTAIVSVAAGLPFLGLSVEAGTGIGYFAEDPRNILYERHYRICRALCVDPSLVADRALIMPMFGRPDSVLFGSKGPRMALTELEETLNLVEDPALLVIDNAAIVYHGDENARAEVTAFITALNGIAERFKVAIVLISHTSKTQGEGAFLTSGSTAWFNATRSVVAVEAGRKDPKSVWVKHAKSNHSTRLPPLELKWRDDILVPAAQDTADQRSRAELVFLECLVESDRQGRFVSDKPRAGNYAPRLFVRMPASMTADVTVDDLAGAMETLFARGAVELRPYDRPAKNLTRIVLGTPRPVVHSVPQVDGWCVEAVPTGTPIQGYARGRRT